MTIGFLLRMLILSHGAERAQPRVVAADSHHPRLLEDIRMVTRRFLILALMLGVGACASTKPPGAARQPRDLTVLSGEELLSQAGSNLYDQIRRVRPNWLRSRGVTSLTQGGDEIVVYRDGVRQGGLSILRDFPVESVEIVRFLSGPEAASRFGLDHQSGAILVTTRKR